MIRNISREVFFRLRDTCNDYWECFGGSAVSDLTHWLMKEIQCYGKLWVKMVMMRSNGNECIIPCLCEALSCVRLLETCKGGGLLIFHSYSLLNLF